MDYKQLGVYSLEKDSIFNGNFLKIQDGYKYEILEFPIGKKYTVENGAVLVDSVKFPLRKKFQKIFVSESFLFICYCKVLEIYDLSGSLVRKIESTEQIVCGTGGFLVFDRVYYILNYFCETVFVTSVPNIIDFTGDGVIMSINFSLVASGGGPSSPGCGLDPKEEGCLVIQSVKKKILYDCADAAPIVKLGDISVYRHAAKIDSIVACSNIKLELLDAYDDTASAKILAHGESHTDPCDSQSGVGNIAAVFLDCILVLCKDCVFVIYDDIIVKKQLKLELTNIIPERFAIHNYIQETSVYDCILMLNCFKSVRLFRNEGIENFLVGLMNSNGIDKRLYEKFIGGLKANESATIPCNTILCRAYRQVDDGLKTTLDRFVDTSGLSVDDLYYLIIYKPELTEAFVQICKKERQLFYLEDLKLFFEKTGRLDELKKIFLRNGMLIFEYRGLEHLAEVEKNEIKAQKACFLATIQ